MSWVELSHFLTARQSRFTNKVEHLSTNGPAIPLKRQIRGRVGQAAVALGLKKKKEPLVAGFNPSIGLEVDAVVYFPDNAAKMYQLTQWLPVLENHPADLKFGIVVRSKMVFEQLQAITKLPLALVPTFAQLMELYRLSPFTAVLYVNNGVANFQSLSVPELVHIHVNHGESDKICMVSNQVKAYDRVFVAGEAAVRRHRAALSEFNESLLIRVGRPQLDVERKPVLPPSEMRTILYAPTWEGEDEANNYTSMETIGEQIVLAALAQDDVRVIYKPHPRIIGSKDARIADNHNKIVNALTKAAKLQPAAGHQTMLSHDILAIFPSVDLLITDVSSVGLDFLYLRPEAAMILTDRRNDLGQLHRDAPISIATPVLNEQNSDSFAQIIRAALDEDSAKSHRIALRDFYFDNVTAGSSTPTFYAEVRKAIDLHSADMQRAQELANRGTGPDLPKEDA
jgi:hypothetical protein